MMSRLAVTVALLLSVVAGAPAHAADKVSDGQWFHKFLKTTQAHAITKGEGVKVAVIDSGVDASHPDLAGAILAGNDLTSSRGGDGSIDADGHGTVMAGLIAANGRVKGVAPEAKIIPVRTSVVAEGASDKLALGVKWAVAQGAKVISISLGGPSNDLLMRQQIEAAIAADVVIVAAAGNRPMDNRVMFPAAFAGVVAVAGVDRSGDHSKVSVTGSEIAVAAPSDNISSTSLNGSYSVTSGTSDATAIVAGAVALIRSKYPDLSATEVVRRLTATATDKGTPGRDEEYGYGVLNLVAALTADLPVTTTTTTRAATTTAAAAPTQPPSDSDGLPWWLLAVLSVIAIALLAVGIAILIWLRQRRT